MVLDEAVEQRLGRRSPDLPELERLQFAQAAPHRTLLDRDQGRSPALGERIGGRVTTGRKLDEVAAGQFQHHSPADHVAQLAVRLDPVPSLAQLVRQSPSACRRMSRDQLADEGDIGVGDVAASVAQRHVQTVAACGAERKVAADGSTRPAAVAATAARPEPHSGRHPESTPPTGGIPG